MAGQTAHKLRQILFIHLIELFILTILKVDQQPRLQLNVHLRVIISLGFKVLNDFVDGVVIFVFQVLHSVDERVILELSLDGEVF